MPSRRHLITIPAKTLMAALLVAFVAPIASGAYPNPVAGNVDPTGRSVHDGWTVDTLQTSKAFQLPSLLHSHTDHDHGDEDHWCGTDLSSPEAVRVLARIREDRLAGKYDALPKHSSDPDIGDRLTFNVSEGDWISLEFELVDKTALYHLWVHVDELSDGEFQTTHIAQLRESVLESTPSRSINPDKGSFSNNHDVFGLPPNIDGDGIVDVLMYDIGRGTGNTLGYVSGTDQLISPPEGQGNQRDILYLDAREGLRNFTTLAAIAVHEYTHLIHLTYGWDSTFISEGMAEYSMVMNGYYYRSVNFIGSVFEVSQPLFHWEPPPSPADERDYQRAGLLFTYIGEQYGPNVVAEMMQDTQKKGPAGMDSVLTNHGSSLGDMIADYHTANHINDRTVDPRFGYLHPERSSHRTFLSSPPINGEIASTTGEGGFTFDLRTSVSGGAVYYGEISNVADFTFVYDTPDPTGLFYADKIQRNRIRLMLESPDGSLSFRDVDPSGNEVRVDGAYTTITFALIHESPSVAVPELSTLEAWWTPLSMATSTHEDALLPQAFALTEVYPNPFSSHANVTVTLPVPGPVTLELVDLLGRVVERTDLGRFGVGTHTLQVQGDDLPQGTYLIRLISGSRVDARVATLVR